MQRDLYLASYGKMSLWYQKSFEFLLRATTTPTPTSSVKSSQCGRYSSMENWGNFKNLLLCKGRTEKRERKMYVRTYAQPYWESSRSNYDFDRRKLIRNSEKNLSPLDCDGVRLAAGLLFTPIYSYWMNSGGGANCCTLKTGFKS